MTRMPSIRIFLLLFLGVAAFADVFQDQLLAWIDPEFAALYEKHEETHGGLVRFNSMWPFNGDIVDKDFSDVELDLSDSVSGEFIESLELSMYVDQSTIKGCFVRYLIVDVSPQAYGALHEWKTWRRWWKSACFSGGISKALFILSFYVCLISTAQRAYKDDFGREPGLTALTTSWGSIVFGWGLIIVPFALPLLDRLNESIRFVFPGVIVFLWSIVWFLVRAVLFLINLIGFNLIGTLILVVLSPLLIMHGYVILQFGM